MGKFLNVQYVIKVGCVESSVTLNGSMDFSEMLKQLFSHLFTHLFRGCVLFISKHIFLCIITIITIHNFDDNDIYIYTYIYIYIYILYIYIYQMCLGDEKSKSSNVTVQCLCSVFSKSSLLTCASYR